MNTGENADLCVSMLFIPQRQCPDVGYIPNPFFASEVSKSFDIVIITQSLNILTIKFLEDTQIQIISSSEPRFTM